VDIDTFLTSMPVEVHVIRLGDMVIATNRFELYLDFGIRVKARSPAVQTFVVPVKLATTKKHLFKSPQKLRIKGTLISTDHH
jgi:hypothetical protein